MCRIAPVVALIGCVAPLDPQPAVLAPFVPFTPPEALPECVTRQLVATGGVFDAERGPDGTVWASGSDVLAIRLPDGSAATEALPPGLLFLRTAIGPDGTLWGFTFDDQLERVAVLRRDGPGAWSQLPLDPSGVVTDLVVVAEDDVRVVAVDMREYLLPPVTEVWHWDGGAWTLAASGETPGGDQTLAVLADGTDVVGSFGWVGLAVGGALVPVPTSPDAWAHVAGPDGTIVGFGEGVVIGDAVGGLVDVTPPLHPDAYADVAWVGAADDVLLGASRWDPVLGERSELWHWDGAAWTAIPGEFPGRVSVLLGPGDDFVALGFDRELWAHGDATGFVLERESWGMPGTGEVAADRLAGDAWGAARTPTVQQWTPEGWITHVLPLGPEQTEYALDVAVDGGHGVVISPTTAVTIDGGVPTVGEVLDPAFTLTHAAAAGGASFVAGRVPYPVELGVWTEAGAGWSRLDPATWPPDLERIESVWADGPGELWLGVTVTGYGQPDTGGVVRWDGAAFSLVASGLPRAPRWMARLADGRFAYMVIDVPAVTDPTLWTLDDDFVPTGVVGLEPDVRAATVTVDGTWLFTAAVERLDRPGFYEERLLEGPLGGPFTEQLVPRYGGGLSFDAWGGTVWTEDGGWTWTRTDCAP